MKLEREALAHFLDTSWGSDPAKAAWEILGEDIDDMSVDLNPDTETKENILGKTKVTDKGYQPIHECRSILCGSSIKTYPKIREIAMGRLKGDACKTLMLEVIVEDTEAVKHLAYAQEVLVNHSLTEAVLRALISRSMFMRMEQEQRICNRGVS